MKDKATKTPMKNLEETDKNTQNELLLIYTACAKELIRQVSVQCIDRGETLQEVIDILMKLKILKINKLKQRLDREQEKCKEAIESEVKLRTKLIEEFEDKIRDLQDNLMRKTNSKIRLKAKLQSLQQQNEMYIKQGTEELDV